MSVPAHYTLKTLFGTLPTVSRDHLGHIYRLVVSGSDDAFYVARQVAAGTYEWVELRQGLVVQEEDVTTNAVTQTLDFDGSDFTLSSEASNEVRVSLAYGTSAGTPAEGNHAHALNDLSDVVINSTAKGQVVAHDGTDWDNRTYLTYTIGPYYIADLPGTATTQAQLAFFNTTTALSLSTNDPKIQRAGNVVGGVMVSDDARTAGTATLRVRINGTGTDFDGGTVVLDATNTTSDSRFTTHVNGVAFTASQTVGAEVVTSGWTPTTANVSIWLVISLDPFTG